ncbi:afadin- and alpha-actinin-binding protein B-like isoform X2 [Bolinopsis microptera]|uniref:afadin- and alpha-actinin-binding protein B-like isoform X2 n=1 Tax=Bolinopsis microptera TaxID=2820187 RepID=UPI00307AACE0
MASGIDSGFVDMAGFNRCLQALGMETVSSQEEFQGKLHDVSNFHMGWINERNALEERCSKMQADSNNYLNMMDRLQGELEAVKRELTAVGEKERQTRVKNKHLASRLKQEEDEMKRLTLMMEHKQDHFNHDIRKKERETLQMKERLSKKIMEKKTEKGTQQVLNTMPRTTTGRRAQWGDDPREELYKQLVEEQEERNKELFEENDHLRHCLASLETELINVLNSGDKDESFLEEVDLDPKIISHINMPYTVVQNTFKSSIDDKIELIKEKHRRMACNKEAEEEIASLRKAVETQQLTLTEQMVALEDCTCKEERQNYSDAHDAELESRFQQLMEETDRIEKGREDLKKEKEDLRILENKIKDDHKRFREERTQLFESNLLATPNLASIKRENNHRHDNRHETRTPESPITITEVARPGLREGHLYFSPAPSETPSHLTTPPPTQNTHIASTDEFNRELSRLDLSNLHGKILNENNLNGSMTDSKSVSSEVKDCSMESSRDLFHVKQSLINQYMNTPV